MSDTDGTRITLGDGRVATVRPGKGRDLKTAARWGNPADDPLGFSFALLAVLTTIDGETVTPEDVEELPLADVTELQKALGGKSPALGIS